MVISVTPPVSSHGELHHAFKFAFKGAGLFKLTFLPDEKTYVTYALWLAASALLFSMILGFILESTWLFSAAMICELVIFMLAELELQRGVRNSFPDNSTVSTLDKQPWRLRRTVIRYVYFIEYLKKVDKLPTLSQLVNTLDFIEINRTGQPPTWTGYFRHPLVLVILGSFVYLFNTKIIGASSTGIDWINFLQISLGLIFLLMIGGLVFTFRYMEPHEQWKFECCLRWLKLELDSDKVELSSSSE